ncbi:MAG: YwaF family protein [Clostridia bacterium]|nr:YwaF family protein [Clostridia bacterium]
MLEFFGLADFRDGQFHFMREAEGAWSWQHITFVSICLAVMVALAIFFGMRNKDKTEQEKNKVLIVSAFLIDGFEIVKIVVLCIRAQDPLKWLYVLPLFLCSIQLIAIPMAAFCNGRLKEACLDFVFTFGILGAIFGTVGATQNYAAYPVLSMDNVFSGITHSISGFASLYIGISGMRSMKSENFPITISVLLGFSILAYVANSVLDYNYMFLMYHDGTPYSIFWDMVGGSPVFYPLTVVGAFVLYLVGFYAVDGWIQKRKKAASAAAVETVEPATETVIEEDMAA